MYINVQTLEVAAMPDRKFTNALKIPVRRETREKFNRIAVATRRTLTETADIVADHYIAHELSTSAPETAGAGR